MAQKTLKEMKPNTLSTFKRLNNNMTCCFQSLLQFAHPCLHYLTCVMTMHLRSALTGLISINMIISKGNNIGIYNNAALCLKKEMSTFYSYSCCNDLSFNPSLWQLNFWDELDFWEKHRLSEFKLGIFQWACHC